MDMDDVEVYSAQKSVETLRNIEWERHSSGSRPRGHRQAGPHSKHRRSVLPRTLSAPGAVEKRVGPLARCCDQTARLARASANARGGGNDHAMAPLLQLSRSPFDEFVDLVALAPRQWRHMDDAEAIRARWHTLRIWSKAPLLTLCR